MGKEYKLWIWKIHQKMGCLIKTKCEYVIAVNSPVCSDLIKFA